LNNPQRDSPRLKEGWRLRKKDLLKQQGLERCAKLHERIIFRRLGFAHQGSTKVVHQYGRIFVEDITINGMNYDRSLNRSIRDETWSQFFSFVLSYKAQNAGREFRKLHPA